MDTEIRSILEGIEEDVMKMQARIRGPAYGIGLRACDRIRSLRERLMVAPVTAGRCQGSEARQPSNCDRSEDRSHDDRSNPSESIGPELLREMGDRLSKIHGTTEAECLAAAQVAARHASDFIDQAAILSPSPTHAMLYSAIAGLLRGDFDEHLIRFISGAKGQSSDDRIAEIQKSAKDLMIGDYDASSAWDFVRGLAGGAQ